jgi:prephenate dehydratase
VHHRGRPRSAFYDARVPPKLGTLGGPGTFAAQATAALQQRHPELAGDVAYFPDVDAVIDAVSTNAVPCVMLSAQTQRAPLGPDIMSWFNRPARRLYVNGEVVLPYGCLLLGRSGTTLDRVGRVLGHGSLRQCTTWLDEHLPGIERVVHAGSSQDAAREVAAGDGTLAVVATATTADSFGLATLADGIDGGAAAVWWLIANKLAVDDRPDRIVVAGTVDGGALGDLVVELVQAGWRVRECHTAPTGARMFEWHTVAVLTGSGMAAPPSLSRFDGARLVGAFRA